MKTCLQTMTTLSLLLLSIACGAPYEMTMVPGDGMHPDTIYPTDINGVDPVAICNDVQGDYQGRICTVSYENIGTLKIGELASFDDALKYFENYKNRVDLRGTVTGGSSGWDQDWQEGTLSDGSPLIYWRVEDWFFSIRGDDQEGFDAIIASFIYIQ